jgi:hypothetical protein
VTNGTKPTKAEREARATAARALRRYDDDYLLCRRGNLGHSWEVVGYYRGEAGQTCRLLECPRCTTTRTDRWDRDSADRLDSHYAYAEGYAIETGEQHLTVDTHEVRREVMRRADVYANEDAMLAAVTGR